MTCANLRQRIVMTHGPPVIEKTMQLFLLFLVFLALASLWWGSSLSALSLAARSSSSLHLLLPLLLFSQPSIPPPISFSPAVSSSSPPFPFHT